MNRSRAIGRWLFVVALVLFPAVAYAAPAPTSSPGDTAWMITATVLVLFMTLPGLALFYGGLVRVQNVLSVLMHCFTIACVASVMWIAGLYSLSFSDGNGWIGDLQHFGLRGIDAGELAGRTYPETVFVMFQLLIQAKAVGFVAVWSVVGTALIIFLVKNTVGLRVNQEAENIGLDRAEHGETAYHLD